MLNSVEHEILNAHKYKNIKNSGLFSAQISLSFISVEKRTGIIMGVGFLAHGDMVSAVLGCPVSSRLISIPLESIPVNTTSYMFMHQHLDKMTMRLTTSTSNFRKL